MGTGTDGGSVETINPGAIASGFIVYKYINFDTFFTGKSPCEYHVTISIVPDAVNLDEVLFP